MSGKVGDVWLADGTHYSDTGRTAVANINDTVASMTGFAGQFNANQATSGSRPTLRETGGRRYFEFDGGDVSVAGNNANWNFLHNPAGNGYVCCAMQYGGSSDPNAIMAAVATYNSSGSNTGFFIGFDDRASDSRNNATRMTVSRGTGAPAADAIALTSANNIAPPQTDLIIEYTKTGIAVAVFVNTVSRGTGNLTSANSGSSQVALNIGYSNGNFPLTGRIYGLIVCNAVPNSTERAAIQADMSSRCVTPPI
ncbi:MAG: hypothetical protein IBJ14_05065 [Hydrogenophaga sp.]|nr:hypothetical protein [Hydrogenophaga sp.]